MDMILLFFIGFSATSIGTLAGSGGLISFPAMILLGVPVHSTIAANKFANTFSSCSSFLTLVRQKKIAFRLLFIIAPFSLAGGITGSWITSSLSEDTMKTVAVFLLCFALLLTFVKRPDTEHQVNKKLPKKLFPAFLGAGVYNGAFGPGQATLLMHVFHHEGIPYISSVGLTRINTFVSSVGATVIFLTQGFLIWSVVLPLMIGSVIGAQAAIRIADKLARHHVKWLLRIITILLTIQLAYQLIY